MKKLVECHAAGQLPPDMTSITVTAEGPDSHGRFMAWATSGSGTAYRAFFRTEQTFKSGKAATTYMQVALRKQTKK